MEMTKRGRRFERRLAERRERAAMKEKKTIFDVLYEARGIAERAEYRRAHRACRPGGYAAGEATP